MQPSRSGSAAGRVLRNAFWVFAFGMPIVAVFVPDLWETYFIVVIGSVLCLAPYWRAHLFRLKTDDSEPISSPVVPTNPTEGLALAEGGRHGQSSFTATVPGPSGPNR